MRSFSAAVQIEDEELGGCDWLRCDVQLIVDSTTPNMHQSAPLGQISDWQSWIIQDTEGLSYIISKYLPNQKGNTQRKMEEVKTFSTIYQTFKQGAAVQLCKKHWNVWTGSKKGPTFTHLPTLVSFRSLAQPEWKAA